METSTCTVSGRGCGAQFPSAVKTEQWRVPPRTPGLHSHLQLSLLSAGMQLKVRDADGRDNVSLPSGVTGTVGEDDFIVALTSP